MDLLEPHPVVVEPPGDGLDIGVELVGEVLDGGVAGVGVQGEGYVQGLSLVLQMKRMVQTNIFLPISVMMIMLEIEN